MILLDTHAWLWWADAPQRLSSAAREAIAGAERIGVSTLSAFELAMLVVRGRISLDRDVAGWVRRALARERVVPVAPSAEVSVAAAQLGDDFPRDPIDRLVYTTARAAGAQLITRDRAIRAFDARMTVW